MSFALRCNAVLLRALRVTAVRRYHKPTESREYHEQNALCAQPRSNPPSLVRATNTHAPLVQQTLIQESVARDAVWHSSTPLVCSTHLPSPRDRKGPIEGQRAVRLPNRKFYHRHEFSSAITIAATTIVSVLRGTAGT